MGRPHSRYAASDDASVTTARYRARPGRARGFTLVELVMVILLLGVMATFSSQFIGIGTQIYGDASRREQLMSDARFAMERLNREVRDAVPGSVRVEDEGGGAQEQGACLRFWPIATAGRYLETASSTVLRIVEPVTMPAKEDTAIIYPLPDTTSGSTITLDKGCVQGRCTARVTEVGTPVSGAVPLTLASVTNTYGQRLGAGDVVNLEVSDLLSAGGAKASIATRTINVQDLIAAGVQLHRAAQQGGPFVIRHALHLAAGIVRQMLARIGVGCAGTGHFHHGGQADVRTGRADPQLIAAAFHFPAVGLGVPVAECLVVQRDGHGLAFAGLQLHLGKAFQLLCGAEYF